MMQGPVYEYIELKNAKAPIKITRQKRMKGHRGAPLHWHEAIEFYFILSGGVEVLCNGRKEWLYAGDTAYISWCEIHKGMDFLDETEFLSVQIDLSSLGRQMTGDSDDPLFGVYKTLPTYIRGDHDLIHLSKKLLRANERQDMAGVYLVKAGIYELLAHLLLLNTHNKQEKIMKYPQSLRLVRDALFYISSHFQGSVSLEILSKVLGVTKQHLSKVFKEQTGQTVHQYINEFRCHSALSLIRDGLGYMEAAYTVGYEDYNYFSRVFKKVYGQSPRGYLASN